MTKVILFLVVIASCSFCFAQDSITHKWNKIKSYSLEDREVWSVDILENYYTSNDGLINKFNKNGELMFSQSIKSLGKMTRLIPINAMKLIHFSEEQQTICFFDNTLSMLGKCLELTDKKIINAGLVCSSSQPNKFWILDNYDSRLLLLSLNGLIQEQELKNLKGILNINSVTQILERGNRLFLLDPSKGVYVFDVYGSLIEFIPQKNIQQLDAFENSLFTLLKDSMHIRILDSGKSLNWNLPMEGITEFMYVNQFFYFRTKKGVHKYELQFSN